MRRLLAATVLATQLPLATAALITDPNDARSWQGASVSTFAGLYGLTTQQVVDKQLLDDGLFSTSGYTTATMIQATGVSSSGTSLDLTGTGSFDYTQPSALGVIGAGSAIDEHWVQTDNVVGHAIWDLGFQATKAAVFNTIDHGPLPGEAIESTVYLSNDQVNWTLAVVERVWLEGFMTNTGILWDGFTYAVGTGTSQTFRYASVIHGGPGALIADGDNEINGIMGLNENFSGNPAPEPASLALVLAALGGLAATRRRA